MSDTILVAIIGAIGTVVVAFFNSFLANNKTIYRIDQLEQKVERHNNVVERTAILERDVTTIAREVRDIKNELHSKN